MSRALTYDEWKAAGYQVRKGEKATGRNEKCQLTFKREQVDEADGFDRKHNIRCEDTD